MPAPGGGEVKSAPAFEFLKRAKKTVLRQGPRGHPPRRTVLRLLQRSIAAPVHRDSAIAPRGLRRRELSAPLAAACATRRTVRTRHLRALSARQKVRPQ